MRKRLAAILLGITLVLTVSACGGNKAADNEPVTSGDGKIKVSVTFNAMKEFVEAVGKDCVEISVIIPDGSEPHDFEPRAQDIATLGNAQVFVYNGLGMEAWTDEVINAADNENIIVVDTSEGVTVIDHTKDEDHDEHDSRDHEGHEHGQYDPHIWLSLKNAEVQVENIKNGLVKADPDNASFYEENSSDYIAQLETLYNEYAEKFQSTENKTFVTGHAAFAYLCRDFGLVQNSVEDVFAEGEPNAQQLSALIEFCKENRVTTVFAEELASPAVSQTLADSVGAQVKTIYTIESSEDGKTYLQRMEENLAEIYSSLI